MLKTTKIIGIAAVLAGFWAVPAQAMPFSVSGTATVVTSTGSYAGDLVPGTVLQADIALSTDETDAFNAITTPSAVPGHEFTSFYEFATADGFSWTGDLVPPSGGGYAADVMGIVVNNDLSLTSADTGGLLPDGTYDWIELLGSTAVDVCLIPGGCDPSGGVDFRARDDGPAGAVSGRRSVDATPRLNGFPCIRGTGSLPIETLPGRAPSTTMRVLLE